MSTKRNRRKQGAWGESHAEQVLRRAGYQIVARNWRCPEGEIDLIAQHDGDLVFIEVRGCAAGIEAAAESISARKLMRLRSAANAYLHDANCGDVPCRFDLAAIDYRSGAVEIVRDAFSW
ncbi:MAG: YraN family protein [Chloroflexi bacterium]|jgi:putative endonuclease|nr:YraN family protein [Chloroflexota bacterium]